MNLAGNIKSFISFANSVSKGFLPRSDWVKVWHFPSVKWCFSWEMDGWGLCMKNYSFLCRAECLPAARWGHKKLCRQETDNNIPKLRLPSMLKTIICEVKLDRHVFIVLARQTFYWWDNHHHLFVLSR